MIKIAYLILTHQDAPLTIRVARKLTTNTSNHVFVHVDAKTDIKPYAMLEGMAGGRIHLLKRGSSRKVEGWKVEIEKRSM